MKSLGEFLKYERRKSGKSLAELEREIKIKKHYIVAVENQNWESLPDFPVVVGFVKNIASALGVDREKAMALLRRDYPPKSVRVSPKPDVGHEFKWGPRLTFFLLAILAFAVISFYLGFQYWRFQKPPVLTITSPTQEQLITEKQLVVKGVAGSSTSVTVNGQPTAIDDDGHFSLEIELKKGAAEIEVVARSRSGKETVVKRQIKVEF